MTIEAVIVDKKNLTNREAEVFRLVCMGLSDKGIAKRLSISVRTVTTHLDHIYQKMDIKWQSINTRCAAIAYAVAKNMVKLGVLSLLFVVCLESVFVSQVNKSGRVNSGLCRSGVARAVRRGVLS